jgi:hypothetical protein
MALGESARRARRAASRAERRLRARAFLRAVAFWLPLPLGYAASALTVLKLTSASPSAQRIALGAGALLAAVSIGMALRALLRRPAPWSGALALDEHHGLSDRITTALSLLERPEAERTALSQAAIEDGLSVVDRLDPRRAVPVPIPRELGVSVVLAALLVGAAWFEIRVTRVLPPPASFEPLVMAADDLELFSDIARRMSDKTDDPESLAAIRRFNALVEDIAARRLERQEAFERMSDLEAELAKSADIDREARELGLEGLGRELQRSGLAKTAAQALEEKRLADAAKALRELADKLKKKGQPPSRSELEKLRGAVERASRQSGERLAAIEQRRRELAEEKKSLLKKKSEGGNKNDNSKTDAKLAENQRKLERLERDQDRAERAARQLSDLDRQLAQAASDLMKDMQAGAEDIRRSADEVEKVEKREMSEKEKRELLERLREMKELLRQQGQAGQERMRQMRRFGQRARGASGGDEGERSGKPGQKGQGQGQGQGTRTEHVQVPRIVQVPGGSGQPGQGKPGDSKGDQPGAGPQAGSGHDDRLAGEATNPPKGETHDVSAAAVDTGQGSASAEVIHGAAERGFVGKAYRDVYVDYQTVAEQSLEHDEIPPGYRFYVRRYFQLIRPRE